LPITSRCDRHNNIKTAMFDNNLITIKTLLHSFKSKASACLAVILFGALAIPALAQGTPPAASANCTVTAMNRTAPLQALT
jgi:hypothetical protein